MLKHLTVVMYSYGYDNLCPSDFIFVRFAISNYFDLLINLD